MEISLQLVYLCLCTHACFTIQCNCQEPLMYSASEIPREGSTMDVFAVKLQKFSLFCWQAGVLQVNCHHCHTGGNATHCHNALCMQTTSRTDEACLAVITDDTYCAEKTKQTPWNKQLNSAKVVASDTIACERIHLLVPATRHCWTSSGHDNVIWSGWTNELHDGFGYRRG